MLRNAFANQIKGFQIAEFNILQKLIAKLPKTPGTAAAPPSPGDLAYYKIMDEGDALLAAGDYVRAIRAYDRAKSHYTANKLTLGLGEVDNKIAHARAQQKRPQTAPAATSAPRQPK